MPGTSKLVCLIALPAALVAIGGCGSSNDVGGKIPATNAAELNQQLDAVDSAVLPDQCGSATAAAQRFYDDVNQLPDTSGTELKAALRDAGNNLKEIVAQQCSASGATGPSGDTSTSSTTTSAPPPTSASSTTSTTSTTSSTQETSPQGNGGGNPNEGGGPPPNSNAGGNGNGQGGGNPGGGNGTGGTGGGVSG